MIDLRLLRDNPDICCATAPRWSGFESLRAEQKSLGKVAQAQGEEKQGSGLPRAPSSSPPGAPGRRRDAASEELRGLLFRISNVVEGGRLPAARDDYVVLREEGTIRDFAARVSHAASDHLELATCARSTPSAVRVLGARLDHLTGVGARLELAPLNAAMDTAVAAGFTPVITPTLVRPEVMQGTGFLGAHADEIYRLEKDDLYLVGTSEVALAGYHANEIVDLSGGPLRYAGWSACYRREAGSHGKDVRGIIRVHQFHKVEMFSYCDPADAAASTSACSAGRRQMLRLVDLPYRVIDTAAGDLGRV